MEKKPSKEALRMMLKMPADGANPMLTIEDLQSALADAVTLGFLENPQSSPVARPKRGGPWLAERLCTPGSRNGKKKSHQKALKAAYAMGFQFAIIDVEEEVPAPRARPAPRPAKKKAKPSAKKRK